MPVEVSFPSLSSSKFLWSPLPRRLLLFFFFAEIPGITARTGVLGLELRGGHTIIAPTIHRPQAQSNVMIVDTRKGKVPQCTCPCPQS